MTAGAPGRRRAWAVVQLVVGCALAGALVAGLLLPVVGGLGLASNRASDTVTNTSSQLVEGEVPLMTTITDRAGAPVAYLYDQQRIVTPCSSVADTMKAAIIAIEDRRFLEHDGVDWRGVWRAAVTNVTSSGSALEGQGASTLTMQLVKNYRLYALAQNEAERAAAVETTPARKLSEIRIALQLERELSKDDILCRYLDLVFFGNRAYGIGSAALTYFGTTPDRLTIAQAALLAGLVRSTNKFDPVDEPVAALERRDLVIDSMLDVRSIDRAQADAAKAEPLGIVAPLQGRANGCVAAGPADGFYCQYVVDYLAGLGIPIEELDRGGYTIRTNLDRFASDQAKRAANLEVPIATPGIASAMAVVEPGRDRHRVRALVSSRDYGLDVAAGQTSYGHPSNVQPFGAGSIYKIFTAAAALDLGLGIGTRVPVPPTYTATRFKDGSEPYTVRGGGREGEAPITLQDALARSPNTSFVYLADQIGSVAPIVDMAYRLGMRQGMAYRLPDGRPVGEAVKAENRGSFTLGPEPTSPLDLANVAATIMSAGTWCPPTPIDAITDRDGAPVPLPEAPCEQAVPEGLANTLAVGMSKDDAPGGTARAAAQAVRWTRPMMGKTGTSQDNKSAGFVGATPQMAGAVLVWPDSPDVRPICDSDPPSLCGRGDIFGGKVPARTWYRAMVPIHEGLPPAAMPPTDPRYVDGGSDNRVPRVIGQGEASARRTLERAGFGVRVRTVPGEGAPRGTVVAQSSTGAAIRGADITLSISDGSAAPPEAGPPSEPGRPPAPGRPPPPGRPGQPPGQPPPPGG